METVSSADIAHQKHVAKLRSLGSTYILARKESEEQPQLFEEQQVEVEDEEEKAYRDRLRSLAEEAGNETVDLFAPNLERLSQSAGRAQEALKRSSIASPNIAWVAGEGKKLLIRSIDNVTDTVTDSATDTNVEIENATTHS